MKDKEPCFLTIRELSKLIEKKEVSPVEVTTSFLERINQPNGQINAYITVLEEEARKSSQEAERAILSTFSLLSSILLSSKNSWILMGRDWSDTRISLQHPLSTHLHYEYVLNV